MTTRICLAIWTTASCFVGCSSDPTRPAPAKNGRVSIYDGVEFESDDKGDSYVRARIKETMDEVTLVFTDDETVSPFALTFEMLEKKGMAPTIDPGVVEEDFTIVADAGEYSSLHIEYVRNYPKEVLLSVSPAFKSGVRIRVRGQDIRLPIPGSELKKALGEPEGSRRFVPYRPTPPV